MQRRDAPPVELRGARSQGVDELDSTSVAATPCTLPQVEGGRPLRIGVPREYAVAELSSAAHEARL